MTADAYIATADSSTVLPDVSALLLPCNVLAEDADGAAIGSRLKTCDLDSDEVEEEETPDASSEGAFSLSAVEAFGRSSLRHCWLRASSRQRC